MDLISTLDKGAAAEPPNRCGMTATQWRHILTTGVRPSGGEGEGGPRKLPDGRADLQVKAPGNQNKVIFSNMSTLTASILRSILRNILLLIQFQKELYKDMKPWFSLESLSLFHAGSKWTNNIYHICVCVCVCISYIKYKFV